MSGLSDRQIGYRADSALPRLNDEASAAAAHKMAKAARPRPTDENIPKTARDQVFAEAILSYGSLFDARRHNIIKVVWALMRALYPTYGFGAHDLFGLYAVKQFIVDTDFETDHARYAAWKILRRIGRNACPESWWYPTAPTGGRIDYTPYSTAELDYFEGLAEALDTWLKRRYLMVFLLAIGFGLNSADIAVAHGADCRISNGPVRIQPSIGRSRIIPADEKYAKRLRNFIRHRKDTYLIDTPVALPNPGIVRAILRPTGLVQAGAKLPDLNRLASTWRYRRFLAGVPVPAITYLSGRSSHNWLHHFGTIPIGLSGDDFDLAQIAPTTTQLSLPFWQTQPDHDEDELTSGEPDDDFAWVNDRDDPELDYPDDVNLDNDSFDGAANLTDSAEGDPEADSLDADTGADEEHGGAAAEVAR